MNQSHKNVWGHRDLKRAKEIFAISIIAKAMSKSENLRWWIHKPKIDPPDGIIGTIVKKNDIEEMHVREVEVVEHLKGKIIDTIKKKLNSNRYEPNTILICFVTQGGLFDFDKTAEALSREITSLEHIFLVFTGLKVSDVPLGAKGDDLLRAAFNISSVQIKPIFSHINIDIINDCKDWRNGKTGNFYIFEGRGKGGSREITTDKPPELF